MGDLTEILNYSLENIFKPTFLKIIMCAITPIIAGSIAIAKIRICIPSKKLRFATEWAIKIAVVATIGATLTYTIQNMEIPSVPDSIINHGESISDPLKPGTPPIFEDPLKPGTPPIFEDPLKPGTPPELDYDPFETPK